MEDRLEIPLNILKEKLIYCIQNENNFENEAVKAISLSINVFFKDISNKISLNQENKKKIMIKDIKNCIENEKKFSFLNKLIEKWKEVINAIY